MKTNSKFDLSIIIVNWNTKELLKNCLNSIYDCTKKITFEVIVVDNNSPDKSADMVSELFPQVCIIKNETNAGFAKANNQGLDVCQGNTIMLLNPDTLVKNNAIGDLCLFVQNNYDAKLGIITCKLLNEDGSHQPSVNSFYSFWNSFLNNRMMSRNPRIEKEKIGNTEVQKIDWAHGAVMVFTRDFLTTIGKLDEQFYIYAEEIDYYLRSKKAGLINLYIDSVEIMHLGGASSRQNRANMFIQNYRSFFQLLKKHYGWGNYMAYRLRSTVYLLGWYIYFVLNKDPKNKVFVDVYAKTLWWNLGLQKLSSN